MKYAERDCCFEDNSSSQHVLIATKQDEHLTKEEIAHEVIIHKGKLNLWYTDTDEGYGRGPFQVLSTYEQKLSYIICEYCGYLSLNSEEYKQNLNMILSTVQMDFPDVTEFEFRTQPERPYLDVDGNVLDYRDVTGYYDSNTSEWKDDMYCDRNGKWHHAERADYYVDFPQIGWIDHQSMGRLRSFINRKGIDLREFLTNKKYIIIIDGDEKDTFETLVRLKIIDIDNFEDVDNYSGGD